MKRWSWRVNSSATTRGRSSTGFWTGCTRRNWKTTLRTRRAKQIRIPSRLRRPRDHHYGMTDTTTHQAGSQPGVKGLWNRLFPDPILGGLGVGSFLLVLITYLTTISPTVSFWDCGEFIACSHILGIPHPPGTPTYILLGRIFAILPTAADPALRINLLSAIPSAFGAGFAFFVLARLITSWYGDRYPNPDLSLSQRLSIYAGSFCGSLMFAFSSTNWSNAVEAEVYGLAMLLMVLLIWLSLVWRQKRDEPMGDRLLALIAYLALLSVGVHMTVLLAVVPIFLM
ncbi:MAG: DUF2723 domain-containing protein, partial [candidate division Zixibacteria bacterium]|nr:DUF2723 domain-containing protein [candidate division Zixibacteria bacterium]